MFEPKKEHDVHEIDWVSQSERRLKKPSKSDNNLQALIENPLKQNGTLFSTVVTTPIGIGGVDCSTT